MIGTLLSTCLIAQCANVTVPEATEQAMRYYASGNWLWIVQQAWGLMLPFLFIVTGFSGKLGWFSQKLGRKWLFALFIYLLLFIPLLYLFNFPLDFYSGYIREHEYGFSNQDFSRWLGQYLKEILVTLVGALGFVWIFYLLLKKSPKRWWLYSSFATIILTFFLSFIQPIWIAPLFNEFLPMKNKQLEQQILKLADRAGISGGRIFQVDKSRDTKTINAYVTGLGGSNRIVLWDTAIEGFTQDQLLFVMGHEMGHYVLRHVWWQFVYLSVTTFLIFYLTYKIGTRLVTRHHKRFGFSHLYEIASAPLLLLLIGFFSFLLIPCSNCVSRYMEHEADRFGLEITQNNQAAGDAFVILQKENLANPNPGPIYRTWRSSHPPLKERVEFSNSYCPWKEGDQMKYKKYFKDE